MAEAHSESEASSKAATDLLPDSHPALGFAPDSELDSDADFDPDPGLELDLMLDWERSPFPGRSLNPNSVRHPVVEWERKSALLLGHEQKPCRALKLDEDWESQRVSRWGWELKRASKR